jgi:hypothetical protein
MFTTNERAAALKSCRSHVRRPIQRRLLVAMLDDYNSSCGSTHSAGGNDCVKVTTDSDAASFFSSDPKSLLAFRGAGGVLLQTSLSSKLVDRRHLLCDLNFWRFWDIIVMRSGWTMLNTENFNAMFSAGSIGYIALVRSIPNESSLSWSGSVLAILTPEVVCSSEAGYGVFMDIYHVFRNHIFNMKWGNQSSHVSRLRPFIRFQRRLCKYQFNLLHRMISCQVPAADILMFVVDLNVILLGFISHLPVDFDADDFLHRRLLLVEQLLCYVNFSCYRDAVSNLRVFCNVEYL